MIVPSFINAGYVWQILGRKDLFAHLPPFREQPDNKPSWIGLRDKGIKIKYSVQVLKAGERTTAAGHNF